MLYFVCVNETEIILADGRSVPLDFIMPSNLSHHNILAMGMCQQVNNDVHFEMYN